MSSPAFAGRGCSGGAGTISTQLHGLFFSSRNPHGGIVGHQKEQADLAHLGGICAGGSGRGDAPSFHLEALKAQAVAARTYAYRRILRDDRIPEHPEAHLSSDYRSGQAWISWDEFLETHGAAVGRALQRKIRTAVKQTTGIIACYDGEPILAVYHSTSGGARKTQSTTGTNHCPTCVPWKTLSAQTHRCTTPQPPSPWRNSRKYWVWSG